MLSRSKISRIAIHFRLMRRLCNHGELHNRRGACTMSVDSLVRLLVSSKHVLVGRLLALE